MDKLTRRGFLFGLTSVLCLGFTKETRANVGLFDPFSFAYVTDVHLCNGLPDSFKMLQESQLFLQDVVKQLNGEKLDFVIFGGDQVERPGKDDANWQLFLDVVQGLNAPWSFVLGEQDVSGPPAVDKMRTYGPDWKGKGIESNKPYWSQSPLPGVHLIGLDTSRPNSPDGELSAEQLQWLKDDLQKNTRRFTVVFSHHPLLPPAPFDGGPPWDDYIVPQGSSAREILGSSKYVRLALSGHVHMTKIQKEGDIWYVSGPSLNVFPCGFRIFRVTPDDITVETHQISFPALVKKARMAFASCPLAFKYNERRPEAFLDLANGNLLDQDAVMPLAAGSIIQPLTKRRRKAAEQEEPSKNKRTKEDKHKRTKEENKPKTQEEPAKSKGKKRGKGEKSEGETKEPNKRTEPPAKNKSDELPGTEEKPNRKEDIKANPQPETQSDKSGEPGAPDLAPSAKPSSSSSSSGSEGGTAAPADSVKPKDTTPPDSSQPTPPGSTSPSADQ